MKYSSRELKLFNLFALFLFGLGGVFFTVGITQLALQPKNEYIVSKSLMNADPKGKGAVTNAPAVHQKNTNADDLITMEGMNLSAVSNGLIGAVFMVLSFLLNSVLLRVMRQDGKDFKAKHHRKKG